MFYVENLAINEGVNIPPGGTLKFDIPIPGRWAKVAYIKIVQLTAGAMALDFDIWETSTYDPADRTDLYLRRVRRNIALTAAQGGEYGEALSPKVPYKDRDTPGEERTYALHCRIRNADAASTASDFAVVILLADMAEDG